MILEVIPEEWNEATFGDVLMNVSNGIGGKQNKDGLGIPVSRIETIASETIDFDRVGYIAEYPEDKIERYRLQKGEILFSHINSPTHLGKTAIFDKEETLYHGINLLRLVLDHEGFDPYLFNRYCKLIRHKGEFAQNAQHAVNQSSINQKKLAQFKVPLPPLAEQKEIAGRVDRLKARLDAIPAILKRFRQSVLSAATSGKLTEEWRKENQTQFPYPQTKIGNYVHKIEAGKNLKCIEQPPAPNEFGIIKISAVTWGIYNEEESKTLPSNSAFLENRRIQVGDFLISRANTIELLGNPVIVHKVTKNLMLSDKVLRLCMEDEDKPWASIFLRSFQGRKEIENRATGNQHSMRNIGQKALLDIDIPRPSPSEQTEIVRRVEELFGFADNIESRLASAQGSVNRLTQSILAKAFRGELTADWRSKHPDLITGENSAQALLQKIQAAREALNPVKKKTNKPAKKGSHSNTSS